VFRAAACGQLVFVSLADHGPGLREELGAHTWELIEQRFSAAHTETAAWTIEHAANWKVVVENSLEGYHLPVVHPRSLRKLSSEHSSTHVFDPQFTSLENTIPPGGAAMTWVAERWSGQPSRGYRHHLAYPSLMLALTDVSSMTQVVVPTSPTTCRSLVWSFVHRGDGRWLPRVLAPILGRVVNRFTRQVQREDNAMFPNIQRGLQSSSHPGVIGAREERVHGFQRYVERALQS
jgi:phenylpropionate dioxygenase-like ring-hydroxylating dioxygenase large terminal subunit